MKLELQGGEQLEALQKKLMRWTLVAPDEVKKVLALAANKVRNEVDKHFHNPKMPRGVPGGAGTPSDSWLGIKTGTLRGRILQRVTAEPGSFSAVVGTNIWYARRHEFGTNGMPERPFLRPSLEKIRPEAFKMIEEAFFKSYGK